MFTKPIVLPNLVVKVISMSKTVLMSQQALSKHPGTEHCARFWGVVRRGNQGHQARYLPRNPVGYRRLTCTEHEEDDWSALRSCGRSEAPPVAWEAWHGGGEPWSRMGRSGGEEGIPDEGAPRAGDPQWVHGNCENNKAIM